MGIDLYVIRDTKNNKILVVSKKPNSDKYKPTGEKTPNGTPIYIPKGK
jgi:hypothetical protein